MVQQWILKVLLHLGNLQTNFGFKLTEMAVELFYTDIKIEANKIPMYIYI